MFYSHYNFSPHEKVALRLSKILFNLVHHISKHALSHFFNLIPNNETHYEHVNMEIEDMVVN